MKKLIIAFICLFSTASYADKLYISQVDYTCLNNCTQKNYQYAYCQSVCSFGDNNNNFVQPQQQIKQIDYACVNDCTGKGYQYQYCTSRCSY